MVGIHAIGGMAGIGKTAFAVHAAHRLAERFPDGQFFLPLHAHTPGQRPVEPVDALASLLLTAGVGAQQIPPGLPARAARWRDYLAGKKVLLLLDDAAGHEQVSPLLPGTGGSVVLITSRRHLTALADAAAISLDTLAPGEAAALLARLAGRPGLGAGDGPAGEITRLCGYLPLAIGMLARQLHHHPAWTAADVAAELATAAGRLELMRAENLSVAAAFDLSYQDLTAGQQRLFRRLGVHPGPDIDAYAAAALDGTDLAAARRHLDGLYDQYLLAEPARGRYRLHDLLARARPRAGVRRRPGRRRRRGRAAAGLLRAHRRGRRPAHRNPEHPRRPAAARRAAGRRPAGIDRQAGFGVAGGRAGEPARGGRLRRRERAARACHRHPRRDQRLLVRPGSLGSVRRPAPGGAGRRAAGRGPGRAGRCPQRAGHPAADDRGLPGRCRQLTSRRWSCTAAWVTGSARPAPWTSWAG